MKRVYVNDELCMGCGICRVHCRTEHSESKDILKAHKKEIPKSIARIRIESQGSDFFSLQCRHCDEPWCVYSCLTGAMKKDPETGIVTVDEDKCMGCWTCILACPNGCITRDLNKKVVAKCDLCPDRDQPICVANCPNNALAVC